MRNVLKLPFYKDHEDRSRLVLYDIISIVLEKCLAQIVEKMDKDLELTHGD